MYKTIIHIILSTLISSILVRLNLTNNERDFINYIFDYAYDYLYDIFKHYIYPKIIYFFLMLFSLIKDYIIDVKSRLW